MTQRKILRRLDADVERPEPEVERPADGRRKWYFVLLGVGGVLLAGSVVLAITGLYGDAQRQLFQLINHAYLPVWVTEQIAKPVSNAVWGMAFLVTALLLVPKYRLLAWQYVAAAGSSYAAVFVLEHLVNRFRTEGQAMYDAALRIAQDGPGFPSGRVAVLTALVLTAWPFITWPWRIVLAMFVTVEAWSRVFLGADAPLDVAGGLAVAAVAVAIIHLLPGKIRKVLKIAA